MGPKTIQYKAMASQSGIHPYVNADTLPDLLYGFFVQYPG
jgi:hypothetical protein